MALERKQKRLLIITSIVALAAVGTAFIFRKQLYSGAKFRLGKLSKFKRNLVKYLYAEHKKWDNGKIKEGDSRTMPELRKYWKAVGWEDKSDRTKIKEAWSAAFISYVMEKAGAGKDFKKSPSHSTYIRDSIKNRKENNSNPFKAYRLNEKQVEVGDLVCYSRQSGVDYDTTSRYKSHCDIVVNIDNNKADVIGGNVGNTVGKKTVNLKNGLLNDSQKDWFTIIKTK